MLIESCGITALLELLSEFCYNRKCSEREFCNINGLCKLSEAIGSDDSPSNWF